MIKKIKNAKTRQLVWLIPLLILLAPFLILGAPILYVGSLYQDWKAKTYFSKNMGKKYFFYKNKGGWSDFIKNNVIPSLPPDTIVYNITRDKGHNLSTIYKIFDLHKISLYGELPFLITLTSPQPTFISLKSEFSVSRKNPKRDENLQKEIMDKLNSNYA